MIVMAWLLWAEEPEIECAVDSVMRLRLDEDALVEG
jgi:hypothetical protein